jgi:4-hydroxy-3-methylbut-2-enyl diphosphate reductase
MLDRKNAIFFESAEPAGRPPLDVRLAAPRGFCAGVRRAIKAVEDALTVFGPPVYVRRAIVHNLTVVRELEAKGAVFVEELAQVPRGAPAILSAHGVPRSVVAQGEARGLRTIDAVCPLVAKVHREVVRHHRNGRRVVLIGHAGHPEILGTLGQVGEGDALVIESEAQVAALPIGREEPVAYAVQTTFSVDEAAAILGALRERFTDLAAPAASDICYATTNRQTALKAIAAEADAVIVAGARFSSNACRLAEVARASGCPSVQLVGGPGEIDWAMLEGCERLGISAAASTPESVVEAILQALQERFVLTVSEVAAVEEKVSFRALKVA